ncbi:MAG: hypothetical protein HY816_09710 [Candidatus Wallbacteria bacterium]|nr:hypothetical protein [Candidatus Wallbacteria bacterium]
MLITPLPGDNSIVAGGGRFLNDGPYMSYGSAVSFKSQGGRPLRPYVPAQ